MEKILRRDVWAHREARCLWLGPCGKGLDCNLCGIQQHPQQKRLAHTKPGGRAASVGPPRRSVFLSEEYKSLVITQRPALLPVRRCILRNSHLWLFWPGCRLCSRCSWHSLQQEAGTEESCTTTHTPCAFDLWQMWKEQRNHALQNKTLIWHYDCMTR